MFEVRSSKPVNNQQFNDIKMEYQVVDWRRLAWKEFRRRSAVTGVLSCSLGYCVS
jgi:hypothetical protein